MRHPANLHYSFEPLSSGAEFDVVTFKLTIARVFYPHGRRRNCHANTRLHQDRRSDPRQHHRGRLA